MMTHALSFDVEEWYHGNLHRACLPEYGLTSRLPQEWEHLLGTLAHAGVRATFFILGVVADRLPHLVRATAAAGHEIASHGFAHDLVYDQPPETFTADLHRARCLLQDLTGQPVAGFRAPSWSIRRRDRQALQSITRAGHTYSSTIFPFATPLYGDWTAPVRPYWHHLPDGDRLLELPPAVRSLGPLRVPYGGGIYWRLAPGVTTRLLQQAAEPQVIYLHPWELNPQPAPVPPQVSRFARIVLTWGVRSAGGNFAELLRRFSFAPMGELYRHLLFPLASTP